MEIVITIIICITILVIVGIICYTKYKLEGIDYYRRAYEKIDKVINTTNYIKDRINNIETKINRHIIQ